MAARVVPSALPDPHHDPRQRFAAAVRQARKDRGWSQDELAAEAGVSVPTIQRYETGKSGTPDPVTARPVFRALGLDPRLIPVLLGYVTAEEMDLPPELPRVLSPTAEEALRILEDPTVPAAQKAEWLRYLRFVTTQGAGSVVMEARTDLRAG